MAAHGVSVVEEFSGIITRSDNSAVYRLNACVPGLSLPSHAPIVCFIPTLSASPPLIQ